MTTILSIAVFCLTLNAIQAQNSAQSTGSTTASSTAPRDLPPFNLPPSNNPDGANVRYAAGLLSEEGEQDLPSAAAAYRQAIQDFDRQREGAANAIFRLGEVYRKMGRIEEARVQYARILREFPDMVRLTELSHALLLGDEQRMGAVNRAGTTGAVAVPKAGTDVTPYNRVLMERYGIDPTRPPRTGIMERYGIDQPPQPARSASSPAIDSDQQAAERIACISNLKQLGLAARISAVDHEDAFPTNVEAMSNEIAVTKVLICPSDTDRQPATSWEEFNPAVHMTYSYLGAGVKETDVTRVLFQCPIHGHRAFADGSVHAGQVDRPATASVGQTIRERYGLSASKDEEAARRLPRLESSAAEVPPAERTSAILNTILNQLRQIEGAKQQWALENRMPPTAQPTEEDLANYLRRGFPSSSAVDRYEINQVRESPVAVLSRSLGRYPTGHRITLDGPQPSQIQKTPQPDPATLTLTADGRVAIDGESIDLEELEDRLGSVAKEQGSLVLAVDEGVPMGRILEVLDACKAAGDIRVILRTGGKPAIVKELDQLAEQMSTIEGQLAALQRQIRRISMEAGAISMSDLPEARARRSTARQRLEALSTGPDRLPGIVNQDERYQRLKAEYEAAVLSADDAGEEKRALTRLREWVDRIYTPELEAEVNSAVDYLMQLEWQQEQLEKQLERLTRESREKAVQLESLRAQYRKLGALLD